MYVDSGNDSSRQVIYFIELKWTGLVENMVERFVDGSGWLMWCS